MILIFCVFLTTSIIANPINKHSLEHNIEKRTALHEEIRPKAFEVKSNMDASKFLTQSGYNPDKNPSGSKSDDHDDPQCQLGTESTLRAFQTAVRVPITKKLDATALKLTNTPLYDSPDSSSPSTNKSKLW